MYTTSYVRICVKYDLVRTLPNLLGVYFQMSPGISGETFSFTLRNAESRISFERISNPDSKKVSFCLCPSVCPFIGIFLFTVIRNSV